MVSHDTYLPIHEYFSLRAQDVDAPWLEDSLDFELAAWGTLWFPQVDGQERVQWDVSSAHATQRWGAASVRLGRQVISGGAARYARFDGVRAGFRSDLGVELAAYAGLTVLPRWDMRPGYYQLGSARDTLLRDPAAIAEPDRAGHWLYGVRADYRWKQQLGIGLSYHEQQANSELERRQLGLDTFWQASEQVDVVASAVLDTDSTRLSELRLFTDYRPLEQVLISGEYLHAEPALYLSRQSVLSVFSMDAYDELGADVDFTPWGWLRGSVYGYAQLPDDVGWGARTGGQLRIRPSGGALRRFEWQSGYARVLLPEGGYHSLQTGLSAELAPRLAGYAQWYGYFYDRELNGYRASNVYALNLDFQALERGSVLWGLSAARSPYAELDLQTLLRFNYALDFSTRQDMPPQEAP